MAVTQRARQQHLRVARLLDEMDVEYGPIPVEVVAVVAREWPATRDHAAQALREERAATEAG
jgi:hypothetical protein